LKGGGTEANPARVFKRLCERVEKERERRVHLQLLGDLLEDDAESESQVRRPEDGQVDGAERVQAGKLPLQTHLGLLAGSNADGDNEDPIRGGLNAERKPARRAVGVGELVLHLTGSAFFHAGAEGGEHGSVLDAGENFHHGAAQQFLPCLAGLPGHRAVDIEIAPVEADELATFQHVVERLDVSLTRLRHFLGSNWGASMFFVIKVRSRLIHLTTSAQLENLIDGLRLISAKPGQRRGSIQLSAHARR
jgi:hypothetical protein